MFLTVYYYSKQVETANVVFIYIYNIGVGLSLLLVSTGWACESLYCVGRVTVSAPRFLL